MSAATASRSTTLVGPNGDAHVYSPSPADAKKLADAKVVVTNGLGFEGWMARLVQGVRHARRRVGGRHQGHQAAQAGGARPRPRPCRRRSACLAVGGQCQNLCRQYPRRADRGRSGRQGGLRGQRRRLSRQARRARRARCGTAVARIPPERRRIITTHDAFGYFQAAYGIEFIAPQGVSTESEASAADVARIITQIKRQKIPAVFLENVSDPRLIERIAERDRRQDRRHALFRCADRRERPGPHLHRHDPAQYKDAQRGPPELRPHVRPALRPSRLPM